MRNILDRLYVSSIWLAAIMMIGVLVMVLTSIISRLLHFHVPGTDAYAGYAMAGAGFLALAHTLKCNEHIRVTLIISKLHKRTAPCDGIVVIIGRCFVIWLADLLCLALGDSVARISRYFNRQRCHTALDSTDINGHRCQRFVRGIHR